MTGKVDGQGVDPGQASQSGGPMQTAAAGAMDKHQRRS
jgi:hypothetical protein